MKSWGGGKSPVGDEYDVIIIGAGPAGLAAAVYTGRARLKTLVLEKAIPGGQILRTDWIENYPGFPDGVSPPELMKNFKAQAERFGAKIEIDEVIRILKTESLWMISGTRKEYETKSVIVATGSNYRKLGIAGEERLTGRGVSYCATCDGAFFLGREIAVVGGGDNALTEAQLLTKFARKVWLIHRRGQFRGEKILQERVLANPKIEVLWDRLVIEIRGESRLESLLLRDSKESRDFSLNVDGVFISIGMDPASHFVGGLLELNSQPGIFAAGDVTDACPNQMATAVGTGVMAALAVEEYLS
jgi:thioredoxin reductase (NADPH)